MPLSAGVGLERTVVPLIGTETFGLLLNTAVVSFIISFGVVKACMNLVSGVLADRYGRKRLLVLGWLVGLPVPFLIIWAPSWNWIVAANILLGINQGLTWSMAVIMKIDLAGPRQRGIAVGFNEFSGYIAVGLTALATGYLASVYGRSRCRSTLALPMRCSGCCSPGCWFGKRKGIHASSALRMTRSLLHRYYSVPFLPEPVGETGRCLLPVKRDW
jgi:MFS family permease